MIQPDPSTLAYVTRRTSSGARPLTRDDLPVVDRPATVDEVGHRFPQPLVVSQVPEISTIEWPFMPQCRLGEIVCKSCGKLLGEAWEHDGWDGVAVTGYLAPSVATRSRRAAMRIAPTSRAEQRSRRTLIDGWVCLLARSTTPAWLPLACPDHRALSVRAGELLHRSDWPVRVHPPTR